DAARSLRFPAHAAGPFRTLSARAPGLPLCQCMHWVNLYGGAQMHSTGGSTAYARVGTSHVMPAQAGIHALLRRPARKKKNRPTETSFSGVDSRLRGNDGKRTRVERICALLLSHGGHGGRRGLMSASVTSAPVV